MTRFEIGRIYGRWQCQAQVRRPSYEGRECYVWVNIESGVSVEGSLHPEPDQQHPGRRVAGAPARPTRRRRVRPAA
ncbi:MAG: hypothetical protein F4Z60_13365 [Chloroflexi bacterium]|nr:hypothetical protein [Chloroflexota bacterium]